MNKQLIILGVSVLLICVGLSGCFEQDKQEKLQDIGSKFIGKWFEEGKDNQYIHFFRSGIVKDNEQNGTWEITEKVLTMNVPISEDDDYLYAIKFNYKFSNEDTRLILNLVEKPLLKLYYTKENVYVQPD